MRIGSYSRNLRPAFVKKHEGPCVNMGLGSGALSRVRYSAYRTGRPDTTRVLGVIPTDSRGAYCDWWREHTPRSYANMRTGRGVSCSAWKLLGMEVDFGALGYDSARSLLPRCRIVSPSVSPFGGILGHVGLRAHSIEYARALTYVCRECG